MHENLQTFLKSPTPAPKAKKGFIMNRILPFLFLMAALLGFQQHANAQTTTITTAGTGFDAANGLSGNSFITFVVENTNTYDVILTGVDNFWKTGNTGTVPSLWYTTTALSGPIASPGIATPTWTNITTGTALTVTANGFMPSFTNLNFVIPAGAQYRFALVSTNGISYSGSGAGTPNPNTFTSGGVSLKVHDAKVASQDVGYSGAFPTSTNSPRSFTGQIHFMPATPCVAPPTGGQAVSTVPTVCPNTSFNLSLTGASGGQGMTYQWQSSANGTTGWTNVTGLNNGNVTTTQTTTTWYRAVLTCSGQTANSLPVQVTTNATPVSGTFTIDQNGTPSATTFTSFAAAIASIECGGASGPIVFNVAPGSGPYEEHVVVPVIPGTSATNTVTFNGNGNTISADPSGSLGVITLDGADFIKFDNLILTLDAAATAGWGVQFLNGADNNTISNNTINMPTNSTSTVYLGIGTGVTYSTYGNHANNSKIQNNIINGGYYGIRMNGTSATANSTGNQITGNQVKDAYYYGIYLYYSGNMLIEGNDISRMGRSDGTTFYSLYNGYSSSNTISKNRIHGIGGSTIYSLYYYYSDSPTGSEGIIKNNLVYDLTNTGTTYGIYTASSDGSYFFHNTIDLDNTVNTGSVYGFYQTTAATNLKFQNNIISIDGGVSGNKYGMYYGVTTSSITSNNNVIHVTNGANVGYYSGAKATLSDWQTASSQDANSVSADPMFVNPTTGILRPTNSTVNGIGAVLTPPVTDDITGATRSTTAPDPGAYEFTPAANDAGILAIISPTSPVQPTVNQPIQVTIKNFGLSPLTSATITATITGSSTQTITFNWTGNLANNQTANATLGNFTFPNGSYTLNVCTSMPNGVTDANPGNDCFTTPIISCTALAGNYTINKGLPTAGTNFASLTEAAQRLTSCGITGPVTFTVAANSGPYLEQLVLGSISGASATNTVTFEGSGNTISATPSAGTLGVVTLDGATYVKVNNFILTLDAAATTGWGVQFMNAADNNTISNNTINMPTNSTSTNFLGIGTGITYSTYGNHTNHSKIQNNIINGGYYGIRMNGTSTTVFSDGNEITGNQVKDPYYYGIYLYYSGDMLVEGNTINRLGRTDGTTFYAMYQYYSPSITFRKNRIHGIGGSTIYGIYTSSSDATVGSENIFSNNLIYDLNNTGTTYAIYSVGTDGAFYYHNTINLDNANNTGTVRGVYQTTAASNVKFQNNIISITGGTGAKTGLYFGTTGSTITSNYNDIYVPVGDVGYYGGAFTTLTNWQTANAGAYDQNSVSADPIFANPATGDLQPTSVAVNNIGTPLTAVPNDILGNPRSTTTPDLGAYEFTLSPNDVGITAISGPVSGCGLTGSETITVTIKNFGTATQTSIPVKLSLNGVDLTPTPEVWTGSLAPNATTTYSFTAKANLATAGSYAIIANTLMTGDSDASNNSLTLNVTNSLMAGMPALTFETPANGIGALRIVTNGKSNIQESNVASLPFNGQPASSTKGMLMESNSTTGWIMPVGLTDPWTNNPEHFSAAYMCFDPQGASNPNSPLWLSFDLKQTFNTANANTNFRVTINGTAVGGNQTSPANTYRPPFNGVGGTTEWTKVYIDLTPYKNLPNIQIGLESSVGAPFAAGAGPANLIDNVRVLRADPTGVKNNVLANSLSVYPNPSAGLFTVSLPKGKTFEMEVTDLTGKVIMKQIVKANATQLDLKGQAQGVYMLKISSEGNTAIQKLVIQ